MKLHPFSISCLLLTVTCFSIIIITLIYGKRTPLHRLWILFNTAVFIWGLGGFLISQVTTESVAIVLWKIALIGVIFTATFFFHIVYVLCRLSCRKTLLFIYISTILVVIINLITRILTQLEFMFDSFYYPISAGYGYVFLYPAWLLIVIFGEYNLFITWRKSTGLVKTQLLYFFIGTILGFLGGAINFLPAFGFRLYPYSNFGVALYAIIGTYAILKYRLMDIKVAITRAGLFIVVYTLVLGLPFALAIGSKDWLIQVFGSYWWMSPLALMAVLATAGPFIYIYVNRKAEERLLREQKRYQNTLKQASAGMTRIRNLTKLLDLIVHIVTKTVRISYAAIYLHNPDTDEFVLRVSRDKGRMPVLKLTSDNPLIAWIMVKREPLIYEEIKRQMEDTSDETYKHLEKNMHQLTASVIIPSFLQNKFIGFFVLGDKLSGQIYTSDDLNVFQVLASQAALAIENALLYEKEKLWLAEQSKRQALADMAPGASHQFDNRLSTISATADNLLDLIKNDSQNFSKEQLIDTVSGELEVIRGEVMKGKQITEAILQKAKVKLEFDKVGIIKVIQNAINLTHLRRTRESLAGAKEPEFIFNYPKDLPLLTLCEGPIQDVFENMFNNAIDAIVIKEKRKIELQNYQGRISIDVSRQDNLIIIRVEDNGIGIQKENLHKLFTDYFTTKATSEKGVVGGSGLGLSVMRGFVESHGGTISVESEYTKWTRFTITLPLDFKPPK